jgi:hypothetical protein
MTPTPSYEARCHCGAIGYSFHTRLAPPEWILRACQCGFCRAHVALSGSDPAGTIEFHEHRSGALERYRFGLRTADFLLCRRCGDYIGALIGTRRGRFGIVNVNALRPLPDGLPAPIAVDYGEETSEQRVARREQRWTPVTGAESPTRR